MMNHNFKLTIFVAVFTFMFIVFASSVSAQMMRNNSGDTEKMPRMLDRENDENQLNKKLTETKSPIGNLGVMNVCQNLERYRTQLTSRLQEREQVRMQRKSERGSQIGENRSERNEALLKRRNTADQNREQLYTILETKATTESQKIALEKFRNKIEEAIRVRRSAVDSAISDFRSSVDKLVSDRDVKVTTAIEKYEEDIQKAFDTAQNSCDANLDRASIRSTLMTQIKTSNELLKKSLREIEKVSSSIETLNKTRQSKVDNAVEEFKTTLEKAQQELRIALNEVE